MVLSLHVFFSHEIYNVYKVFITLQLTAHFVHRLHSIKLKSEWSNRPDDRRQFFVVPIGEFSVNKFSLGFLFELFVAEFTLKSNMSANIYGPLSEIFRFGFIISDKMTESSPYLLLNNFAHSIPNCPRPPKLHKPVEKKHQSKKSIAKKNCNYQLLIFSGFHCNKRCCSIGNTVFALPNINYGNLTPNWYFLIEL